MAQSSTKVFRTAFKLADHEVLRWFPGHMDRGMKQMQQKLINVDCIIEVHDARIPFSGRNPTLKNNFCVTKPHILLLNKKDLCDLSMSPKVISKLKEEQNIENVIYTNCMYDRCTGVKQVYPLVKNLIKNSDRYHRIESQDFNIMVIGIPNVGKSSLIKTLRNRLLGRSCGNPVGAIPGITRSVMTRIKINDDPPTFVLDTPGILWPTIPNMDVGMKMAACNILQDHLVGEDVVADYLLFWMNKYKKFKYVEYMHLDEPSDSITEVLTKCAVQLNKYRKIRDPSGGYKMYPDYIQAANFMIEGFRRGKFGHFVLDKDVLQ